RNRRGRRDVQGEVPRELDEVLVAGHEVRLAVNLDQHADLVAGVDVALDGALAGLRAGALGRLRLAAGAQDLDGPLHVPGGLGQSLAAGQDPGARAVAESLDFLGADSTHAFSSPVGSEFPDSGAGSAASVSSCSS